MKSIKCNYSFPFSEIRVDYFKKLLYLMVKYPLNQESIFNIKTFWTGVSVYIYPISFSIIGLCILIFDSNFNLSYLYASIMFFISGVKLYVDINDDLRILFFDDYAIIYFRFPITRSIRFSYNDILKIESIYTRELGARLRMKVKDEKGNFYKFCLYYPKEDLRQFLLEKRNNG